MQSDNTSSFSLVKAARNLVIPGADSEEIERIVAALKRVDTSIEPSLKPLKVTVLGNITTDYLADHIRLMLLRAGFAASVSAGQYGGLVRALLGEADLTPFGGDAALLILTHRDLQFAPPIGTGPAEAGDLVSQEVDFWASLLDRTAVPTVVLSFDLPSRRILDEQDGLAPGGLSWHVKMTNLQLAARLSATTALVDAEALQYRVGAAHWHDDRLYHLCKQPFAMEALPEISHTLVAALTGLLGFARKVLVLDLDNTIWGGVIGDDGLQGIVLGPESAEGEAFASFQEYARDLSRRGIILAVCSKNREEVARSPFREHSAMVLKESDISCFVANFEDKVTGLRQIADSLNLGLESFVFVDDNPVERALIRAELPEVLVVDLPEDPAYYAQAVEASKAFPLRSLTREDLGRVASYRATSSVRKAIATPGIDMERFLTDLQATAHVEKVDDTTVGRIVQIVRKTNQFKLNLAGFREQDIIAAAENVVALRLVDRLQDYGIVAVAITEPADGSLHVVNWVMSCRAFGRRLETVMLAILRGNARARGCSTIKAHYIATEKNVILPAILKHLGFISSEPAGEYYRPATDELPEPHLMTVLDGR